MEVARAGGRRGMREGEMSPERQKVNKEIFGLLEIALLSFTLNGELEFINHESAAMRLD
jgi:hypothetical protein